MHEAHLVINGKVQGVFFRAETEKYARTHGLNGWVRNLDDGSVEAVMQGEEAAIYAFITWVNEEGPPLAEVREVSVKWRDTGEQFGDFEVR
jgi:acylphosphatase